MSEPASAWTAIARACCYLAVVAIPLYFSGLTATGYEPDKSALVRVLATAAGVAWLAGWRRRRQTGGEAGLSVIVAASCLFVAFAIATVLSIDPGLSLWGSIERGEGLWTDAAYLVLIVVTASTFGSREHVDALVTAILAGAYLVALYGYAQQLGIDPIPASGDPETLQWPVRSSMGQHVFLGSYLVLTIPITAAKCVDALEGRRQSGRPLLRPAAETFVGAIVAGLAFFGYMAAAAAQHSLFAIFPLGIALYVAGALWMRGRWDREAGSRVWIYWPLLLLQVATLAVSGARGAWIGVMAAGVVFAVLYLRSRGQTRALRGTVAAALIVGVLVVLLNIPNGPLQPLRQVHGMQRLANITDSGGATGSAQGRLLIWEGVGTLMTQTPTFPGSWGGAARDVVGYGPETLHWAFERVFPLQLRRVTSEIWTWDRSHDIYLDLLVDAGIFGLFAYLAMVLLAVVRLVRFSAVPAGTTLASGLAATVVGHLVDGVFGIETVSTFVLVSVIAGLSVSLPWQRGRKEFEEGRPTEFPVLPGLAVVGALVVLACALSFLCQGNAEALSALWVASTIVSVAFVTAAGPGPICGGTATATDVPPGAPPGGGGFSTWPTVRRVLTGSPARAVMICAIVAGGALVLGAQAAYQTAAFAFRHGSDLQAAGQYASALPALEQASRSFPFETQYAATLGTDYQDLAAGSGDSAQPLYVPRAGDTLTVTPARSGLLGKDQLLTLAQYSLRSAHALAPLDPDTDAALASLYAQWGKTSRAVAEYGAAEALSHENPRYLDQLALAQLGAGQDAAAHSTAGNALRLDPGFWLSYYVLALSAHATGDATQAKQAAQVALNLVSNYWPPPAQTDIRRLQSLEQRG